MSNQNQQSKLTNLVRSAYKKLKAAIYFDKTRVHLKRRIVEYETEPSLENNLLKFENLLINLTANPECPELHNILSTVKPIVLPKEVTGEKNSEQLISNIHLKTPEITKVQCFLDMDIEGFLLGILWTMLIGSKLDDKFGDYVYGNRIQRQFKENSKELLSPYLFEPYFTNYEKWRDNALDIAERTLDADQKDAVIVTADLKSFYYSVNLDNSFWNSIDEKIEEIENNTNTPEGINLKPLNNAIKTIISEYSKYFKGNSSILPIGFEPSMVLANQYLSDLDKAIINQISPLYYGRYVDDIVLILKVEKESELDLELHKETNNAKLIQYILGKVLKDGNTTQKIIPAKKTIFQESKIDPLTSLKISERYLPSAEARIYFEESKTKIFYLSHEAPRSFLKKFRKQIVFNASQFDLIPSIDDDVLEDDFSFLFQFESFGSPNKIRDISPYLISPYELSKFLGQTQKLLPLIENKEREQIAKKLTNLLDSSSLIRHHTSWEKILKIVAFCNNPKLFVSMAKKIYDAIEAISVTVPNFNDNNWELLNFEEKYLIDFLKSTLIENMSYALSLCSKNYVKKVESAIRNQFKNNCSNFNELQNTSFTTAQTNIIKTYMVDRYSMPIPPVFLGPNFAEKQNDLSDLDLIHIGSIVDLIEKLNTKFNENNPQTNLPYAVSIPYIIKKQDIQFTLYLDKIIRGESLPNPNEIQTNTKSIYNLINFGSDLSNFDYLSRNIETFELKTPLDKNIGNYCIVIGGNTSTKQRIKVAIANMSIPLDYPTNYLNGKTELTLDRYKKLFSVLKETKHEKCDVLILPELIIPIEWLPLLVQFSAKNNIVIISGIGYIKSRKKEGQGALYNLTATILPYRQDGFKFSYLNLHQKVFLPPKEEFLYRDYGYEIPNGESFELFSWNNFWFSTYCCFELASPKARVLYQSIVDAIFAIEWNQDIDFYNYLGNVVARDMSCYFIQANNSSYGDSRIIAPTNHFKKDIVRVTGGSNTTILVETLDIRNNREGQRTNSGNNRIKPPAPDFNHNYPLLKEIGKLTDCLKQQNNQQE